MTLYGLLGSFRMGANHQKEQTMIRTFSPTLHPLGREEGLKIVFMIDHACDETSINIPEVWGLESFQVGEHIYVLRGWHTLTPQKLLCLGPFQTSSHVCLHLDVHLYPLSCNQLARVFLSSVTCSSK